MTFIDLGVLTSPTQRTDRVSTLETQDVFQFRLATTSDVVFSLGANLDWTVRDQQGAIIAESAEFRVGSASSLNTSADGHQISLTGLDADLTYALEVRRTDRDLDYTLTIDPITGEAAATEAIARADGTFLVGDSGQVMFDYTLDGGRYQGEAGIVSLSGLEQLEWGTADWIREIADRVMSNTALGHVLVNDRLDNPWIDVFHAEVGEYRGRQSIEMTPGDTVAIVLIPNGTFAAVQANPGIGGDQRPLFSIATANPNDSFHFGQIAIADRDVYVMEDKRVDLGSDRDYNDFGFGLTGVTPRGIGLVDDLIAIAPGQTDWRTLVPRWENVAPIVELDSTGLATRGFPVTGTIHDENGVRDIQGLTAAVVDAAGLEVRTIVIDLTTSGNGQTFAIDHASVTEGLTAGSYRLMLTPRDLHGAGVAITAINLVIPNTDSSSDSNSDSDSDASDNSTSESSPNPTNPTTNTAPTAPILAPLPDSYPQGTTFTLTGQVTDTNGWADIDRMIIELLNPAGEPITTTTIETFTASDANTAEFATDLALAATFAAGRYGLRVTAIDATGATSPIATHSLVVTSVEGNDLNHPDPHDPDPLTPPQRPNLLKFRALPLYTTAETLRFSNARAADPDGWRNLAKIDFAWVTPEGAVIDIANDVTEFHDGGDGTARFDFEVDLAGLTPGRHTLRGRAIDYDADGSVSGAYAEWSQSVWVVSETGEPPLPNRVRWGVTDRLNWQNNPEQMAEVATNWVTWLTPGTDFTAIQAAIGATAVVPTAMANVWSFELDGSRTNAVIDETLAVIPGVELAYPDGDVALVYHTPGQDTDPLFDQQWPLRTGVMAAWDQRTIGDLWEDFQTLGQGVEIAFIDGGFKLNDPEFYGRVVHSQNLNGRHSHSETLAPNLQQVNDYDSLPSPIDDTTQLTVSPDYNFPEKNRLSYEIYIPAMGTLTDLGIDLRLAPGLTSSEQTLIQQLNVKLHVPSAQDQILDLRDRVSTRSRSMKPGWGDGEAEIPYVLTELRNIQPYDRTYSLLTPPIFDVTQDTIESHLTEYKNYVDRVSLVRHQLTGGYWTVSFGSDTNLTGGLAALNTTLEGLVEKAIESVQLHLSYADTHGTSVMSLAAAGVGDGLQHSILGVAPQVKMAAIQLLAELDPLTQAFSQKSSKVRDALSEADDNHELQVVNNSWGTEPFANFETAIGALQHGFEEGADGLGTVYVWSAGNDRASWPGLGQVGQYPLNSSRFGIVVGAAAFDGVGWSATDYSNQGVFVVAPSSANVGMGEPDSRFPVLAAGHHRDRYSTNFSGTSASAPFVSGVAALLREYNPALTARDIQFILAETAQPIELNYDADSSATTPFEYLDQSGHRQTAKVPENWFDMTHNLAALGLGTIGSGWVQNAANQWFSHRHGFGLIDAYGAMELANPATYELLPELVSYRDDQPPELQNVDTTIPDGGAFVSTSQSITENIQLEWAEVEIVSNHKNWGELTFVLESPSGTSVVLKRAMADAIPLADGTLLPVKPPLINPDQGWVANESMLSSKERGWTFSTPFFRGESALGDWTLRAYDEHENNVSGDLIGWDLNVLGTQPEVSVSVVDGSATEAGDLAEVAIERSGDLSKALTVELNWTNAQEATLANGSPLPSSVVLAAGESSTALNLAAISDDILEGKEFLGVSVLDSPNYYRLGTEASLISIFDDALLASQDYAALKAFYESTGGKNWRNVFGYPSNLGWIDWDFSRETPPQVSIVDEWDGVSIEGLRVTEIRLSGSNLVGSLPAEIGNLSELSHLRVYNNRLSGEIPEELGSLFKLSSLFLGRNNLSGEIPKELGQLSNLSLLLLPSNNLTGEIPPELGNLLSLEVLDLYDNDLTGSIPKELGQLSNLLDINFQDNNLTGKIPPEIGNISNLSSLRLNDNNLSGEIPLELLNLDKLSYLYLNNNNLSGEIPSGLAQPRIPEMPNLRHLDLSGNNFTSSGQVTVTINRINEIYDFDVEGITGEADWIAETTINGVAFQAPEIRNQNDIRPNWQFSQNVTGTTIPITIKLQESDTLNLGFTTVPRFESGDINPIIGEDILTLNLNTLTGEISGSGISGQVGQEILAVGGDDALAAQLWFTVTYT